MTASGVIGTLEAPAWLKPISVGGRAILDLLLKRGEVSQAALSQMLDLSQPSVARLVGGFIADGLVLSGDRANLGRGNPSVQLRLNPDFAYGLGIGLVGDAVSVCLLDLAGNPRASAAVAMPSMTRDAVIERLVALRDQVVREAGIDPRRILGAGVGLSGFFVGEPLRFNPPHQLTDWADVDVAAIIRSALELPVVCENDGTAAAIAESLIGIGRTTPTFAYCHLTNGFGGGLIVDGRPMRGVDGNAGDFGGVLWMLDEGYPNLERLRARTAEAGLTFDTVETMVRRLKVDDPGVDAWIEEARRPIAKLAFLLGHIIAPEKIVIGGRLPLAIAERLAAAIEIPRTPTRHARPFPLPTVVAGAVTGDAAAVGAAAMPLQGLFFV